MTVALVAAIAMSLLVVLAIVMVVGLIFDIDWMFFVGAWTIGTFCVVGLVAAITRLWAIALGMR